jgi:hypothetical protein
LRISDSSPGGTDVWESGSHSFHLITYSASVAKLLVCGNYITGGLEKKAIGVVIVAVACVVFAFSRHHRHRFVMDLLGPHPEGREGRARARHIYPKRLGRMGTMG